jgi:hypothetical protein
MDNYEYLIELKSLFNKCYDEMMRVSNEIKKEEDTVDETPVTHTRSIEIKYPAEIDTDDINVCDFYNDSALTHIISISMNQDKVREWYTITGETEVDLTFKGIKITDYVVKFVPEEYKMILTIEYEAA